MYICIEFILLILMSEDYENKVGEAVKIAPTVDLLIIRSKTDQLIFFSLENNEEVDVHESKIGVFLKITHTISS